MFCKCIDACGGGGEGEKTDKGNVIGGRGEDNMLGALCNIQSTLNVRRTVVTKATQSIHTQTTVSLIHCKNNY